MTVDEFTGEGMKVKLTRPPYVEHCLYAHFYPNADGNISQRSDWGDNPIIFLTAEVHPPGTRVKATKAGLIMCRVSDAVAFTDTPTPSI